MQKLIDYLERMQLILGTVFLVVFVSVTLIQVITRYLGISATWTEEVSVNTFIWSMLLGAAVMVRKKQHFSFNLLDNFFSPRNKHLFIIFQNVIILIFCLLCTLYSMEITQTFWHSRWVTIPSLKQGYAWLILPITFISMSIYLLEDITHQTIKLVRGN
ncbi:TRAP transporter small permease [Conservatibacter flavescens]|uniref:TRAP transporter small permease protein n=1 Tax=Conservatibacter flavescens TaxID=28161 RepID=A0A2M8S289_9PAST|nr:TRAP transporter small permease [Conservatibacter flavescens]PJG85216.1 C4-dicarboxylate ABC transporter permease [Conservatibacter flavescens]